MISQKSHEESGRNLIKMHVITSLCSICRSYHIKNIFNMRAVVHCRSEQFTKIGSWNLSTIIIDCPQSHPSDRSVEPCRQADKPATCPQSQICKPSRIGCASYSVRSDLLHDVPTGLFVEGHDFDKRINGSPPHGQSVSGQWRFNGRLWLQETIYYFPGTNVN